MLKSPFSLAVYGFAFAIVLVFSAVESKAAEQTISGALAERTNRTVLTDMVVPPPCLEMGHTVCGQLPPNSTRKLVYGAFCYTLKNKTNNALFIPLRTDYEIEQFLLNAPANQILRQPCEDNN